MCHPGTKLPTCMTNDKQNNKKNNMAAHCTHAEKYYRKKHF